MAADSTNHISYFLSIPIQQRESLGNIRTWENLKLATEGQWLWLTGFSESQFTSIEVQSIPYKSLYYAKNGKLFKQGSLLPSRNEPSLLWTAINRAIKVTLPEFNHNYFGIQEQLNTNLIPSETEQKAVALHTSLSQLGKYIESAPAVRLKELKWIVLGEDQALILGEPILPIQGEVFWGKFNFLLPLGFDFELHSLAQYLDELLNSNQENYLLFATDGSYSEIPKAGFQELSIGSFRRTMK